MADTCTLLCITPLGRSIPYYKVYLTEANADRYIEQHPEQDIIKLIVELADSYEAADEL